MVLVLEGSEVFLSLCRRCGRFRMGRKDMRCVPFRRCLHFRNCVHFVPKYAVVVRS
jgi:hypothetical protein